MSNLTRNEKQALNDLFATMKEKENLFQKIKKIKKFFLLSSIFILKPRDSKTPTA